MNNKLIFALAAITLVAAALISVATAQFVNNQATTQPSEDRVVPPCATNTETAPQMCLNQANSEFCIPNGNATYNCKNNAEANICQHQNGNCNSFRYGYTEYTQNQNQYSWSMHHCQSIMERNSGYGRGCHR